MDDAIRYLEQAGFERGAEVAVLLGSGFGAVEDECEPVTRVPYAGIPGFPEPAGTSGHACRLSAGTLWGRKALVFRGRYHAYEGFRDRDLVLPVRLAAAWGVKTLLVTAAAGGIREDLEPGNLIALTDHINLMGVHPLAGRTRLPGVPPFPAMAGAYNPELTEALVRAGRENSEKVSRGVYAGVHGPNFETAAEVRMLGLLGADAVGMSVVPEVVCAHALGLTVGALVLITNRAGSPDDSHERALEVGAANSEGIKRVLKAALEF